MFDLPDFDKGMGEGSSDPFVVFTLEMDSGERTSVRTTTAHNARDARWAEETLEIVVPTGLLRGTLHVGVWDDDSQT